MDRIAFVNSIGYTEDTDAVKTLISFFEQYMLLYNLVEDISSVSCECINGNTIQFIIDYISADAAAKNTALINMNNAVRIYGSTCFLRSESLDKKKTRVYMTKT
jgi:hypothetical protein